MQTLEEIKASLDENHLQLEVKNPNSLPLIDYRTLTPLQGELKELSQEDYDKLLLSLVHNGFFVPFFIWKHEDVTYILDGHQRQRLLINEAAEPFELPHLLIEADTLADAKKKLLVITSQFGKMTEEGLKTFVQDLDESWVKFHTTFQGLKPLNLALNRDRLAVDTAAPMSDTPAAEGSKPSASHNDYSVYETLMLHSHKERLLDVIQKVIATEGCESHADALLFLANHYDPQQI